MDVHLRNVLANVVAAMYVLPVSWRVALLRSTGIDVGEGTQVRSRCTFAGPAPVRIGAGGYVSYRVTFDATGEIQVGDRTYIASGVSIGTCTHEIGDSGRRAGRQFPDPVRIGDGVWVGMNATILPGVTIGSGCVIAAGAVVTDDCKPDGLYGGVPARRIQDLERRGDAAVIAA
jgi:maltose O-acetyltransferase